MSKEYNIRQLQKVLLENKKTYVNSKRLADILGVSTRTVRNYVNEINKSNKVILSSGIGYMYNHYLLENDSITITNEVTERIYSMVCKIIVSNTKIDIFELSNQFNVSESTILNDYKKVEVILQQNNLHSTVRDWKIELFGEEVDKRRFLKKLVKEELETSNKNIVFHTEHSNIIEKTVLSVFKKHNVTLNNFFNQDVILHINISIHRMKNNQLVDCGKSPLSNDIEQSIEYSIAKDILKEIEKELSIPYNDYELNSLSILLSGKIVFLDSRKSSNNTSEKYTSPKILKATEVALNSIKEKFDLNFDHPELKKRMIIHIQNLYQRSQFNTKIPAPYPENLLKRRYPLIYEIAITLAFNIQNTLDISISDEEISYLALHIGTATRNYEDKERIDVVVYSPLNYSFTDELLKNIYEKFSDELNIVAIVHFEDEFFGLSIPYDLIITTVLPHKKIINKKIVEISPFLSHFDLEKITENISQIKGIKQKNKLRSYITSFFNENLFYLDNEKKTEIDTINFMCQNLERKGYVDKDFKDLVLKREQMSSTVLRDFMAMPHVISDNSYKTFISILISKKGVLWNGQVVKLIILLNVNVNEKKIFNQLLTFLIEFLVEEVNFNKVISCESYDQLITLFEENL